MFCSFRNRDCRGFGTGLVFAYAASRFTAAKVRCVVVVHDAEVRVPLLRSVPAFVVWRAKSALVAAHAVAAVS
jgi:hypothetical protein